MNFKLNLVFTSTGVLRTRVRCYSIFSLELVKLRILYKKSDLNSFSCLTPGRVPGRPPRKFFLLETVGWRLNVILLL